MFPVSFGRFGWLLLALTLNACTAGFMPANDFKGVATTMGNTPNNNIQAYGLVNPSFNDYTTRVLFMVGNKSTRYQIARWMFDAAFSAVSRTAIVTQVTWRVRVQSTGGDLLLTDKRSLEEGEAQQGDQVSVNSSNELEAYFHTVNGVDGLVFDVDNRASDLRILVERPGRADVTVDLTPYLAPNKGVRGRAEQLLLNEEGTEMIAYRMRQQ